MIYGTECITFRDHSNFCSISEVSASLYFMSDFLNNRRIDNTPIIKIEF